MRIRYAISLLLAAVCVGCTHDGVLLELHFPDPGAAPDHLLVTIAYPGELPRHTVAEWSASHRYLRINRTTAGYALVTPPGELLRPGTASMRIDVDAWRDTELPCNKDTAPNTRRLTHAGSIRIKDWQPEVGWVSPLQMAMFPKAEGHDCAIDLEPQPGQGDFANINNVATGPNGGDAWIVGDNARMHYLQYLPEPFASWKLTQINLDDLDIAGCPSTDSTKQDSLKDIWAGGNRDSYAAWAVGTCGTILTYVTSVDQQHRRWQIRNAPVQRIDGKDAVGSQALMQLNNVLYAPSTSTLWVGGRKDSKGVVFRSVVDGATSMKWFDYSIEQPVCGIWEFPEHGIFAGNSIGHLHRWMSEGFQRVSVIPRQECIAEVINILDTLYLFSEKISAQKLGDASFVKKLGSGEKCEPSQQLGEYCTIPIASQLDAPLGDSIIVPGVSNALIVSKGGKTAAFDGREIVNNTSLDTWPFPGKESSFEVRSVHRMRDISDTAPKKNLLVISANYGAGQPNNHISIKFASSPVDLGP